jgi:hypothetical protein
MRCEEAPPLALPILFEQKVATDFEATDFPIAKRFGA